MIERSDRHPAVLLHGLVLRVSRLPQGDVESIAGHGNALLNGGFITEESEQQHLLRWASLAVHGGLEADPALGQGSGLVGEQQLEVAQVLDAAGGNVLGGAHFVVHEILENDADLLPQIFEVVFLQRNSIQEDGSTGRLI